MRSVPSCRQHNSCSIAARISLSGSAIKPPNGANRNVAHQSGGGASEAAEPPHFRTWGETYGMTARASAQRDFVGDSRTVWGGVAGIGMRLSAGVSMALSIDQIRTRVDVPLALQSATLDLTQLGFNASVDQGRGPGLLRSSTASAGSMRGVTRPSARPRQPTARTSRAC